MLIRAFRPPSLAGRNALHVRFKTYLANAHNVRILDMLTRNLENEEQGGNNPHKIRAFKTAIAAIQRIDHPIRSSDEVAHIRGIGNGITNRIAVELGEPQQGTSQAKTPKIYPTRRLEDEKRYRAIEKLQTVPGIGRVTAIKLFTAGATEIAHLHEKKYNDMLSQTMRVGLKFLHHLNEDVTREQAEIVASFIRENLSSKYELILGGSYRRGAPTFADIDVLIFHPSYVHIPAPSESTTAPASSRDRPAIVFFDKYTSATSRASSMLLQDVVRPLEDRGLIAGTLTAGTRKWQGIVRIPTRSEDGQWEERAERAQHVQDQEGHYRRLDLNLVPIKSRGAALLAMTGDVEYNRDLRTRASNLGMHLNEYGLWRWHGSDANDSPESNEQVNVEAADEKNADTNGYWELVASEREQDVVEELGMDYVEPEKRNFRFVLNRPKMGSRGRPKKLSGLL